MKPSGLNRERPGQPTTGYLVRGRAGPEHSTASSWPTGRADGGFCAPGTVLRQSGPLSGEAGPEVIRVGEPFAPEDVP